MRIALVDDDQNLIDLMQNYIKEIVQKRKLDIHVDVFFNGADFVKNYTTAYDIIFLDIEMPEMNGFAAAKKIREIDKSVCIIFVTNMAQYAILGYEINALDFIVKPFDYDIFEDKFEKAVNYPELFTTQS